MPVVEYPVALILKGWHLLAASVLSLPASASWIVAMIALVVTVRAAVTPLTYRQVKASRQLANLRPDLHALNQEYADRKDKASTAERLRKARELRRNSGYRTVDGCLPTLIQIPIVVALYRLLLRIARPPEGLDSGIHASVGPLSGSEVHSFLSARILNVPLPSFVAMPQADLAYLGVDRAEVMHLAVPMVLVAVALTVGNIALTLRRSLRTMDASSAGSRISVKMLLVMTPMMVFFPVWFAIKGPAPVAILLYWIVSNIWTLVSNQLIQRRLNRTTPYTEAFWEHTRQRRQEREAARGAGKHRRSRGA